MINLLSQSQGYYTLYELFAKSAQEHASEAPYYEWNLGLATCYIIFLVVVYLLFFHRKKEGFQRFVKTVLFILTVLGGFVIYYIGYHVNESELSVTVKSFMALFSTARLFILGNDLVEVHNNVNANFYTWFSVFSVSAALISTSILVNLVGKNLKSWFRAVFRQSDGVYLFLSLNEAGLTLAKDIKRKNAKAFVVFIRNVVPNEAVLLESELEEVGALVMNSTSFFSSLNLHHEEFLFQPQSHDGHTVHTKAFSLHGKGLLRKLRRHPSKVFLLTENEDLNFHLSQQFVEEFKRAKIRQRTDVHIRIMSKNMGEMYKDILEQDKGVVWYHLHNQLYIAASQLVSENLPAKWIRQHYPESIQEASVNRDFSLAVVGFGFTGYAVLRKFYEQGQFVGVDSHFKAVLLDHNMKERRAEFEHRYRGVVRDLGENLEFHDMKVNTPEFYTLINNKAESLDFIVVSLGNDELNIKVAHDIQHLMNKVKKTYRIFVQVSDGRYYKRFRMKPDDTLCVFGRDREIFTEDIIVKGYIERIAKQIHEHYKLNAPASKRINWEDLSEFTRLSNISAAEHVVSKMILCGFEIPEKEGSGLADFDIVKQLSRYGSFEELAKELGETKMLNIGKTEHLRWNAFHFANGWTTWNLDDIPDNSLKSKDEAHELHACLVDWDDLKKVSQRFNENFEQYDLDSMSVLFSNAKAGLYETQNLYETQK